MEMEVNENPETDGKVNVYVIGPANTAIALYDGDPALATTAYVRGLSLVAAVRDGVRTYYHYNAHGDVVQLTNSSGTVTKNYTYDAFGVEQNVSDGDLNPFRYCGEQFDNETGNYYLRARYYSPNIGRFTQEDPIMDGLNWYTYCAGNPVVYSDSSGTTVSNDGFGYNKYTEGERNGSAAQVIRTNKSIIKNAATRYEVDPKILAGVIYVEQYYNVDWVDATTDWIAFYGIIDMSVGVGQVRHSTAILLEEKGYVSPTQKEEGGWSLPFGKTVYGTETMARHKRLEDNEWNITYGAAYLRYLQDLWGEEFPEIATRPDILGALYNLGDKKPPHSNPKPNEFGERVQKYYDLMESLIR